MLLTAVRLIIPLWIIYTSDLSGKVLCYDKSMSFCFVYFFSETNDARYCTAWKQYAKR